MDDGSTLGGEMLEVEPNTSWDGAQDVNVCRTVVDGDREGKVMRGLVMVGGAERHKSSAYGQREHHVVRGNPSASPGVTWRVIPGTSRPNGSQVKQHCDIRHGNGSHRSAKACSVSVVHGTALQCQ